MYSWSIHNSRTTITRITRYICSTIIVLTINTNAKIIRLK